MPLGAVVVKVDVQHEGDQELICLWALVDDQQVGRFRQFFVAATGESVEGHYVGTAIRASGSVWHVFEQRP
jgi:hypothetical protein